MIPLKYSVAEVAEMAEWRNFFPPPPPKAPLYALAFFNVTFL